MAEYAKALNIFYFNTFKSDKNVFAVSEQYWLHKTKPLNYEESPDSI